MVSKEAVLLDGSKSSRQCSLPSFLTYLRLWLIHPLLDSGPPPLSDLWDVEEDRDDPDMLAVERMWRPAAALGPNWLAIMTGRAQEDGVAGW